MNLDPRNYDLGELRGPPAKSDAHTEGTDHADEDDEDPGSTGDARRGVPMPARDDDGRREPTGRARSERGGSENTEGDRERDAGSVLKADTDRNGEHTTPEEQNSASRHTPSSAGTRGARAGAERTTADRYRRLAAVERTFDGDPKKPYLTTLPTSFSDEVVIFEWLDSLFSHAGHRNTVSALRYYREIGWITEAVETNLGEYLGGFDAGTANRELTATDHLDSLLAIAQLASTRRKE